MGPDPGTLQAAHCGKNADGLACVRQQFQFRALGPARGDLV
jgi:hypothetical protein